MVKWLLVIQLLGANHLPISVAQVGPFDNRTSCELAFQTANSEMHSMTHVCVPTDQLAHPK